jgi:hypothetical protein
MISNEKLAMRTLLLWFAFIGCVMMLSGCAFVRSIFGISEGGDKSDGTGGIVGTLINYLIPGAGAVVAAGAGIYADLKRREWKKAAISTFQTINAVAGNGPLKERLAEAHKAAGVATFVESALDKLEGPERAHTPEALKT